MGRKLSVRGGKFLEYAKISVSVAVSRLAVSRRPLRTPSWGTATQRRDYNTFAERIATD